MDCSQTQDVLMVEKELQIHLSIFANHGGSYGSYFTLMTKTSEIKMYLQLNIFFF